MLAAIVKRIDKKKLAKRVALHLLLAPFGLGVLGGGGLLDPEGLVGNDAEALAPEPSPSAPSA